MTGTGLAQAAQALVGTPFRLHGRDPATGLDCVGVLAASLAACGLRVHLPAGYALRMLALPELAPFVAESGFAAVSGAIVPGDVLLVRVGPIQFHLLVAISAGRFVHAHAGLRRVVAGAMPPGWAAVRHWRLGLED